MTYNIPSPQDLENLRKIDFAEKIQKCMEKILMTMRGNSSSHEGFRFFLSLEENAIADCIIAEFKNPENYIDKIPKWSVTKGFEQRGGNWLDFKPIYIIMERKICACGRVLWDDQSKCPNCGRVTFEYYSGEYPSKENSERLGEKKFIKEK